MSDADKHPTERLSREQLVGPWARVLDALEATGVKWGKRALILGILDLADEQVEIMRTVIDPDGFADLRSYENALAALTAGEPLPRRPPSRE